MSKKPAGPSPAALRKDLERLDRDLLKLLSDRARTSQKLGTLLHADGSPSYNPLEEQEVIRRALEANKGPLPEEAIRHIYREILGSARNLIKPLRIAYLGPKYSYSHPPASATART
jgi:chorismate mutase/prephenate dehydratase